MDNYYVKFKVNRRDLKIFESVCEENGLNFNDAINIFIKAMNRRDFNSFDFKSEDYKNYIYESLNNLKEKKTSNDLLKELNIS